MDDRDLTQLFETDEQSVRLADKEWTLFQRVRNVGGPADCQSNRETFVIMRRSQFMSWPPALKSSYERDLDSATAQGRNLISEKYAHMMRYTHPQEYAQLSARLPAPEPEAEALIEAILPTVLTWSLDMSNKYPWLMAVSRPVFAAQDGLGTSIETYTRGELMTYSLETLRLLRTYYGELETNHINLHEVIDSFTVRLMGFASLRDVDDQLARQLGGAQEGRA